MRSITLVGTDGTEFFVGLVEPNFDVEAWAAKLGRAFQLLQIAAVKVRLVATG